MVDRIQLILKVNNLTASRFADEIGVQRSSISHILSGRNMPSLDLIQKVLKRYPEIDPDWLLNGRGSMMKYPQPDLFSMPDPSLEPIKTPPEVEQKPRVEEFPESSLFTEIQTNDELVLPTEASEKEIKVEKLEPSPEKEQEIKLTAATEQKSVASESLKSDNQMAEIPKPIETSNTPGLTIEKIVIFYSNRTFREYFPEGDH